MSEAEIRYGNLAEIWSSPLVIVGMVALSAGWLGFLVWVRRYFDVPATKR